MEFFAKIVNGYELLNFFAKSSVLDVSQGSEYASGIEHFVFWKVHFNCTLIDPLRALQRRN